MSRRGMIVTSALVVVLLAVVAALAAMTAPEGASWPVHWDLSGRPDRWSGSATALILAPALALVGSGVFAAIPKIEPLEASSREDRLLRACWLGFLMLASMVQAAVIASVFSTPTDVSPVLMALGLYLMLIGRELTNSSPRFFIGFRTPWALMDADNWRDTHLLASRTSRAAGVLICLNGCVVPMEFRAATTIGALALATLPPLLYSYILFHRRRYASESSS